MDIQITGYEDWMMEQVATLFSQQYHVSKGEFSILIDNFYDHPFQKEKCIRITAIDGKAVVGFQSFFYWPYEINGKTFRSFQSGNSLVHPDYRGRGIFQKLLEYIDKHREDMGIDFLLGFPIDASKNSLLHNGWKNILNMDWYACPSSLISFFSIHENERLKMTFGQIPITNIPSANDKWLHLKNENNFVDWRKNYSSNQNYFYHTYAEGGNTVGFSLKTSRRKKIIRELTIGNILTKNHDGDFIQRGLENLVDKIRSSGCISLISFAQNSSSGFISETVLRNVGFKKIKKHIYFAVKSFVGPEPIEDAKKWLLFRSDIDTW